MLCVVPVVDGVAYRRRTVSTCRVQCVYIQDERDDKVHWSFTLCVVSNAKCFSSSHIVKFDIDFCIVFQWFFVVV